MPPQFGQIWFLMGALFPVGSHAGNSSLQSADPLTDHIYKQQHSIIWHTYNTLSLLTGLVGGDCDRHTLGWPCTASVGNPVVCVDDEGVVCMGPKLAHHHPGGLQASLAWGDEHIRATGQAELRAGVWAESWVTSRHWLALKDTSPCLNFRSHNPLVWLHPRTTVLSLRLGDAAIPVEDFAAILTRVPRLTDETFQTVAGVTSSSEPARGGPFQDHRGFVHHRDELLWGWGRLWDKKG